MNTYQQVFEKFKTYQLPPIGKEFDSGLKTGTGIHIKYTVLEYKDGYGSIQTVHSGRIEKKTEHWIRKTYNTP